MESAFFIPYCLAASAVRTFADVAERIPKYPARVDNNAPKIKATALSQLFVPKPIHKNKLQTKKRRIRYSAKRNASAPSAIAFAISFILSFPESSFRIFCPWNKANRSPKTPKTGTAKNKLSISFSPLKKSNTISIRVCQIIITKE